MLTHPENCSRGAGRWGSVRTRCPVSSLLYSPHHDIGCARQGHWGRVGHLVAEVDTALAHDSGQSHPGVPDCHSCAKTA